MDKKFLQDRRQGILFYCGVGYVFDEIFYPVIKELEGSCRITVLIADSYLNESTKIKIKGIKESGAIEEFRILRPYRENNESLCGYHKRLSAMAHSLDGLDIDMIVLGEDCQVASRYILSQFSSPKIKKIVLQAGVIGHAIAPYFVKKRLGHNPENKKRSIDFLWTLRILRRKSRWILFNFHTLQARFFFRLYRKKKLYLTGYEQLAFASGFCEHVICYDPLEMRAIQAVNPLLKNVFIAQFPLMEKSSKENKNGRGKTGKLLVMFGGKLSEEMAMEKINRWIEVASEVIKLKEIKEIHLRFHPRLSTELQWPQKMAGAMERLGCFIKIVDSKSRPLQSTLHLYDGIIGSPSGALRVARAFDPSIFIVGLPNLCDGDFGDQTWLLGKGEGIQWVEEGEAITVEKLHPPAVASNMRPTVSDILLNLLDEGKTL